MGHLIRYSTLVHFPIPPPSIEGEGRAGSKAHPEWPETGTCGKSGKINIFRRVRMKYVSSSEISSRVRDSVLVSQSSDRDGTITFYSNEKEHFAVVEPFDISGETTLEIYNLTAKEFFRFAKGDIEVCAAIRMNFSNVREVMQELEMQLVQDAIKNGVINLDSELRLLNEAFNAASRIVELSESQSNQTPFLSVMPTVKTASIEIKAVLAEQISRAILSKFRSERSKEIKKSDDSDDLVDSNGTRFSLCPDPMFDDDIPF